MSQTKRVRDTEHDFVTSMWRLMGTVGEIPKNLDLLITNNFLSVAGN